MGHIKQEVRDGHLRAYPQEEVLLHPFRPGFDITWACDWTGYGTELSVYLLKPNADIQSAFGFDREVVLLYSRFGTLEPRSFQAAEDALNDSLVRDRVERMAYILVSEAPDPARWVADHLARNQSTRLIAAFPAAELRGRPLTDMDALYVRNELAKQFYTRDLFDLRPAIRDDVNFFGRQTELAACLDGVRQGKNRGVFGLRKTGKTSLLFKLWRALDADQSAGTHYIDCSAAEYRTLRGHELLAHLTAQLRGGEPPMGTLGKVARQFTDAVHRATSARPVVLIFDEIEYISPLARKDPHWANDFTDFWGTIRSAQARYPGLSFILSGVNPNVTEQDRYSGIPNPLLGIVTPMYLTGLTADETRRMVHTLGRPMGLKFDDGAIAYLHERYGGHPLLTRIAGSLTNSGLPPHQHTRPAVVTRADLTSLESNRDSHLAYYCEHVISELREFYPDEFDMLELLALKQFADFAQLRREGWKVNHLRDYGLLGDAYGVPRVAIPVVERYLAEKGGGEYIIPTPNRPGWLAQRLTNMVRDLRELERLVTARNLPSLFGPNSFYEAERLAAADVVNTREDFDAFINVVNRCLVESIERYGEAQGDKHYFRKLTPTYPALLAALDRVKVYRHDSMHVGLLPDVERRLRQYQAEDLGERTLGDDPDAWFILQQRVLDRLFTAIQHETAQLT